MLIVYHGSTSIIKCPEFGKGKPENDYGLGFYCTQSEEMAKEWACAKGTDGYANYYSFDTSGLSILKLTGGEYHILNWLAILLENRIFSLNNGVARQGRDYLIHTFLPDYKSYDVIQGYRANDSYFAFSRSFLNNGISLSQLERAMVLGKLGEQIVLKSEKAFQQLHYLGNIPAEHKIYTPKYISRDDAARNAFQNEPRNGMIENEIYLIDIVRERWKNNDSRLQRIILR